MVDIGCKTMPSQRILALGSWLKDKVSNPSLFTMLSTQCASHPRNVTAAMAPTALAPGPHWPGAGGATGVVWGRRSGLGRVSSRRRYAAATSGSSNLDDSMFTRDGILPKPQQLLVNWMVLRFFQIYSNIPQLIHWGPFNYKLKWPFLNEGNFHANQSKSSSVQLDRLALKLKQRRVLSGTPSWLVVWNMNVIFHNIWDNPSHWRTHIFDG